MDNLFEDNEVFFTIIALTKNSWIREFRVSVTYVATIKLCRNKEWNYPVIKLTRELKIRSKRLSEWKSLESSSHVTRISIMLWKKILKGLWGIGIMGMEFAKQTACLYVKTIGTPGKQAKLSPIMKHLPYNFCISLCDCVDKLHI